jgi:hypothetical protein
VRPPLWFLTFQKIPRVYPQRKRPPQYGLSAAKIAGSLGVSWNRFFRGVWQMSAVMIGCPTTGRAVSTAIEIEPSVFRRLANMRGRMVCPACGQEHEWTVASAWLAGEPFLREVKAEPDLKRA